MLIKWDLYKKWDEAPEDIAMMQKCLELKFEQHPELPKQLVATGNNEIIEDCTTHDRESSRFWGAVLINGKWEGENQMGKLLMELRNKLTNKNEINNLNQPLLFGKGEKRG
ncbi:MAG: NADAR family protein [Melioribacteraceae bacterium]|nr:NADAR family protein [Melioribacteraceae bacterium]